MPYDPHGHESFMANPAAARQMGWLVVAAGVVLLVAPFVLLCYSAQGAVPGYRDKAGYYHALLRPSKEVRADCAREPPPGSFNRIVEPATNGDWLLLFVLAVGVLAVGFGLMQVASVRSTARDGETKRERDGHR
jgi:hypothetical protein